MAQPVSEFLRPVRDSSRGRVPPHNLEAEESLLGAMLLSKDAVAVAAEVGLSPDDFYKPSHGHVYDAVTTLFGRGEPADPVTVAEELRRAGLLDGVGGPALLISLQARTPATSSAAFYARIVEEHALLRRLIRAADEIAEIGYELPDDVAAAVDRAESLVYEVAQRRVTDSIAGVHDLVLASLERLERLYEQGENVTGLPTGFVDLDDRLAGLQPSNLIIVGGRPAMGKAVDVSTIIPTPTGWTTMGDLAVGDEVLDDRGLPCRVTYATPVQHDRQCYEVNFDEGSRIIADADHQWFAYDLPAWKSLRERHYREFGGYSHNPNRNPALARDQSAQRKQPRVVTTRQMLDEGLSAQKDRRPNWYLPLTAPLDLPERELPVDPYVLGCWLGDGTTASSQMTVGDEDWSHFREEFVAAGYELRRLQRLNCSTNPRDATPVRVLGRELRAAGLGQESRKRIPGAYLRASAKQRLALLQGLMDTDGCVTNANGTVELCLANLALLEQARELACSLGHKPGPIHYKPCTLPDGRIADAFRIRWTPLDPVFRLQRKAVLLETRKSHRVFGKMTRRAITSIKPVPSVPVRCITVDSPSHLYLVGESMIPTHNTSFALGVAAHAAQHGGKPVLLFSLEMSHSELTSRLIGAEARVDGSRLRNGKLHESDWPKITQAAGRLAEMPLYIDDNPHLTVMEIRAKARRLRSKLGGLGLIVVDYLQLMTGRANAENRQVEVSEISRGLKILARELEVPVLGLSQLSRNLEMRADKRPQLADLRESGSLEQDADVVLFVYRDEIYNRESTEDPGGAEVIIAKHRNGPVGTVHLVFLEKYARFANQARGV
jgi:replicative DNA helicase